MIRLISILLFITVSGNAFSCGTTDNWMDAYEKVKTNNAWRDSMNKVESLVMLKDCAYSRLDRSQQIRMVKIIKDSVLHYPQLLTLRSSHNEIKSSVDLINSKKRLNDLLGSIYKKYNCMRDINDEMLEQYFGVDYCYKK